MKLDRTNPLTKGLLYAKSFGNIYEPDSVSNASPIVVDFTTGVTQSSRYGSFRYLNCTGTTGDYFDCNVSPTWSTGDELTVALLYRGHSGSEGSYIGQRDDTNIAWQIYNLTSSNSGETFNINIGNQTINQLGTSTVAIDGEWHLLHVCLKFGTEVQMFVDGVPDPWGVDSETRTPYAGAVPMSIGMRWATYPATGFETNCDVAFAGLWNRRLSAAEIANHAKNPWQVFRGTPIIGAHQLPEDVVWGAIEVESQGPNGYTIDFLRDRAKLNPLPDGNFGTVDTVTEYGIWALNDQDTYAVGPNYMRCPDCGNVPLWGLAPSKFRLGKWQFSEVDVHVTVTSLATSVWVGPAVFIGSTDLVANTESTNCYAVLCERAGGGTSLYRLYRRRNNGWTQFGVDQTGPDAAIRPVRVRIEAQHNGSATALRWWIDGVEQPPYHDTDVNFTLTGETTHSTTTFAGVSWGSGNAVNNADRKITRMRAGNMPEIKTETQMVPINEDLPDLGTFEKPWDSQPT